MEHSRFTAPSAWVLLMLQVALTACDPLAPAAGQESGPAATVANPVKENELATVTISQEAATRLGIEIATVESRRMPRYQHRAGEVTVPPGGAVTITAPLAGTVEGTRALTPSASVDSGELLLNLVPLLTVSDRSTLATSRLAAERDAATARVETEAAQIELERTQKTLQLGSGSEKAVADAQARLQLARAAYRTAGERIDYLTRVLEGNDGSAVERVPIPTPLGGILREIHCAPGQLVAAGDALCSVVNLDRVWLRVPVYAGDLGDVDTDSDVSVTDLGRASDAPARTARRAVAPPSADSVAATVDLFYELDNSSGSLRPGQKLLVALPLREEGPALVVAQSAIVYDIHGGAWVYEELSPLTYARRRVEVERVADGLAVLGRGLSPQTRVVAAGAAELFGTEFFAGK